MAFLRNLFGQNSTKEVEGIKAFEEFIVLLRDAYLQNNEQMILVIEPGLETMIQTTVDVMDICEKHNILKNLSYSKIVLD